MTDPMDNDELAQGRVYLGLVIDGPLKGQTIKCLHYIFLCEPDGGELEAELVPPGVMPVPTLPVIYNLYANSREDIDRGNAFWSCCGRQTLERWLSHD